MSMTWEVPIEAISFANATESELVLVARKAWQELELRSGVKIGRFIDWITDDSETFKTVLEGKKDAHETTIAKGAPEEEKKEKRNRGPNWKITKEGFLAAMEDAGGDLHKVADQYNVGVAAVRQRVKKWMG